MNSISAPCRVVGTLYALEYGKPGARPSGRSGADSSTAQEPRGGAPGHFAILQPEDCASLVSDRAGLWRRPELLVFLALLAVLNAPVLTGSCCHSMVFLPQAVKHGEWWRLFSHPFVHVTWYHLLLDGTAFLVLYHSLLEASIVRRLLYVFGAGAGGLLGSWATVPAISTTGLCGLSGIAHGLMAVSALELVASQPPGSTERRIGLLGFILVVGKAAVEAMSGRMFFTFLHFGLMGDPVAVSHAGGILGGLLAMLLLRKRRGRNRL
jgi:rhomboid family GlyGly-CTERM serine protease